MSKAKKSCLTQLMMLVLSNIDVKPRVFHVTPPRVAIAAISLGGRVFYLTPSIPDRRHVHIHLCKFTNCETSVQIPLV